MAYRNNGNKPTKRQRTLKGSDAGKPPTYLPEQIDAVLRWIAQGLTQGNINNLAASFDPPFQMSPQLISYYRSSREVDIDKLRSTHEMEALTTGLAIKANRLEALYRLAEKLEDDIYLRKMSWQTRKRSILKGPKDYEVVAEKEFIANLVKELRGVYSDIAAETGGRVLKTDITSRNKPIKGYVLVSPDDWDKIDGAEGDEA